MPVMAMCRGAALLVLVAAAALAFLPVLQADDPCVYTVYVRTGTVWKGGTDSKISLLLYDNAAEEVFIENLEEWGGGLQEENRDYFERGNLDIFSGVGNCLNTPICGMNLSSDGTGDGHGWYVNYVEVTFTGAHLTCNQHLFTVERWLATDTWPYTLSDLIDACDEESTQSAHTSHENIQSVHTSPRLRLPSD